MELLAVVVVALAEDDQALVLMRTIGLVEVIALALIASVHGRGRSRGHAEPSSKVLEGSALDWVHRRQVAAENDVDGRPTGDQPST